MKFSEWLDQNGIKQVFIAAKLGVAPSLVTRWKTGERSPSLEQIEEISIITGQSVGPVDFLEASREWAAKQAGAAE